MQRFVIATFFLILGLTILWAEEIRYTDSWGKQGFNLIHSDAREVELIVSIEKFSLLQKEINDRIRDVIQLPGTFLPHDAGRPNLPALSRFVAIPQGANVEVEVLETRIDEFRDVDIAPAPVIPFDTQDGPLEYPQDENIYQNDAFYPENIVSVSEPRQIRGVDAVLIGVTPFQYNPVSRELKVYRDVRLKITFTGGQDVFGDQRLRSRWWEPIVHDMLLNYSSLPAPNFTASAPEVQSSRATVENVEYLIIVPDDPVFKAWGDSLRVFRNQQGIKSGVVTTTEIGGNTFEAIESYVNNAYYNWETPPSAVLLLADYGSSGSTIISSDEQPHPYSGTYISDNYYADVDGDDLPDIVFARITARDEEELRNTVGKILDYERHPPTNPDFYSHPVTAMGWQTERWFQLCAEVVNGFWEHKLGKQPVRENAIYSGTPGDVWSTATNTETVVDYFGPNGLGYIPQTPEHLNDWGGNATRLNNDINSGAFMIQHRDHGSETGWGEPDYSISDMDGLHNTDLTFVFSVNCLTGRFNWSSECFAEAFHRYSNRALGIIAATQVSYSFVNDTYTWGMYDNMWPEFMPDKETWFGTRFILPAFANAAGKYFLQQSDWPYNEDDKPITYYLFHHHGGAFSMVYSEMPQSLTVSHNSVVEAGASTFGVTADEGSLIGLSVNGEWIASADGTGDLVEIPIPELQVGDTMLVTVTKQNYYRYQAPVEVVSASGAYVTVSSWSIDDETQGNNNGLAEFNERFFLDVAAKNLGSESAMQITGTLSSSDSYLQILQNTHFYGNIDSGQIVMGDNAFELQAVNEAPDQHTATCTITFTDTADGSWSSNISIVIQAPDLACGNLSIDDTEQGNGDLKFDAGEIVDFVIESINQGHADAPNTVARLRSLHADVTVLDDQDDLGLLMADDTLNARFTLQSSESIPLGTSAFFEFTVSSGSYSAVDTFEVIIGDVPVYTMSNSTVTVSNAIFYDSGGEEGDYQPREQLTMTFKADEGYDGLKVLFTAFDVGSGDELRVYDGSSTSAPEFPGSPFTGTTLPPEMESTNSEGALTFYFSSNLIFNASGWRAELSPTTISNRSETPDMVPQRFVVHPNFPNPFNPSTTIRIELPQAGDVGVRIYSTQGELLRTLFHGTLNGGEHQLTWDGKNDAGSMLSSGVYFLVVESQGQKAVRKMMLLK
ncbi:propetide peptidase C25 [Caldithrix abyssi DSM 13497]|uniref:Por secretion system C-terminal sorting domain-containing protein n=1 Tax=Caldithrix abyssi DSM 13497 TaxID=880073 RepID=H1XTJ7_CALAY|nr:C25 family cysteine peptidase [Caldithrix abyssi]APF17360.1 Por secretion system C-terminal sorting domain-containing protein [Caldithrix abyssi DSM 13497]EHO41472.1 propetide peptidase C25 [Caldithrix abyssi DSM 13497]